MTASKRFANPIQWTNTRERFGFGAQLFHAILGLAVLVMLALGLSLKSWSDAYKPYAVMVHKGLGVWVLFGSLAWGVYWLSQLTPAPIPTQNRFSYRLAKLVHRGLLILCIAMPLSGWIMVSAWGDAYVPILPYIHVPAVTHTDEAFAQAMLGVHILFAWFILGLLALHLLGSFYHHVIKRDPLVKRMIPRPHIPNDHYRFQFQKGLERTRKLK
jgi:cytochrome b561